MHEHLFPRPIHARGCCDSCYTRIMELIREGKTTESECVELGMLLPKAKTMQQELEERRKARAS